MTFSRLEQEPGFELDGDLQRRIESALPDASDHDRLLLERAAEHRWTSDMTQAQLDALLRAEGREA